MANKFGESGERNYTNKPASQKNPDVELQHSTSLFALSDNYILSQEWRVIVDLVQINFHGRLYSIKISQVWDPHYGRMCSI